MAQSGKVTVYTVQAQRKLSRAANSGPAPQQDAAARTGGIGCGRRARYIAYILLAESPMVEGGEGVLQSETFVREVCLYFESEFTYMSTCVT